MRDDVTRIVYGVLIGFLVVVLAWVAFAYFASCGFDPNCRRAAPVVARTPIPTLAPAFLPTPQTALTGGGGASKCRIAAVPLIGAWVSAGYPETDPFVFTDLNGVECQATYRDVNVLFSEANLWYPGSLACTTCHNSTLSAGAAQLDLSSYAGVLAGSRRASADVKGNDILGGGVWEDSLLYQQLFVLRAMPFGRPPDVPAEGPVIFAGSPK